MVFDQSAWDRQNGKHSWHYQVVACGFKYNMSDVQAAIGIHQLRKQEGFVSARRTYAAIYNSAFAGVPEVETPPDEALVGHCWHLYVLRLNLGRLRLDRDEFIDELRNRGVAAGVHFIPIPLHPFYQQFGFDPCPRALHEYPRLVSLPLYPGMTLDQVEGVARTVLEIVSIHRAG